jgi:hypothetical protein
MPCRDHLKRRASMLASMAVLLAACSVDAQFEAYPRLGFSAAADRYQPTITVQGDEIFELHIIVTPPDGEAGLAHDFAAFHWAVLQFCCGGAADILSEQFNPAGQSEGDILFGIHTTFAECVSGEVIHLATLSMQMTVDVSGRYGVFAAPLSQALTCDDQPVVLTDMMVYVDFSTDSTPVAASSLSGVKALFR